jgi:hypothetical protein
MTGTSAVSHGAFFESDRKWREKFLLIAFALCATIIIINFLIGIFSPVLDCLEDEISYFDTLWRVVLSQRAGTDFHNPMGVGPYYLGALLWHWFGPHYYVMRLAIACWSLSIAFCACVVAARTLNRRTDLALLFCVTIAFQLSAPTLFEAGGNEIGMSEFYNRDIVSALAVLFLLTFGSSPKASLRERSVDVLLSAILLYVLFLTKISGCLLGLMIMIAGCLLQGRTAYRLVSLCAALLAFATLTAVQFRLSDLEFIPVFRDYELAAHARLAYSFLSIVRGVLSWPLVMSVALLTFFAISRRAEESKIDFWRIGLIIGSYAACQFALNMTNAAIVPSIWLAPAAAASLAICMVASPGVGQKGDSEGWWRLFVPDRLTDISAREAMPLLICMLVLLPEVAASMVATTVGALVSLGIEGPVIVVSAGKGVSFRSLARIGHDSPQYPISLNNGISAILSLNLGHEAIANLDHTNPFPVLFLSPPPEGIQVWWNWGYNVPQNAVLKSSEIIGDACVVTIPARPIAPEVTARLVDVVQSKLQADFETIFKNEYWKIYRRTRDCVTAPHS